MQRFKSAFYSSFVYKIYSKIVKAYRSSKLFSAYTTGDFDDKLGRSVFISEKEKESCFSLGLIMPVLVQLADALIHISLGNLFLILASSTVGLSVSFLVAQNFQMFAFVIMFGLLFLVFCRISVPFKTIIANSLFGKFFELTDDKKQFDLNRWFLAFVCVLAFLGNAVLPFPYGLILPALPIALVLLVRLKPIFFISLICLCLPILGTGVCMALSIVLFFNHLIQRLNQTITRQKIDYVDIIFAVYLFLCVIASVFSLSFMDSLRVASMWVVLFSTVFIIYRNVKSVRDLMLVLSCLLSGTVVACIIGIYQYLSGQIDTTWTDTTLFEDLSIRIYSTFANPNVFGEFLILVLPLSFGLGLYFSKLRYKIVCFLVAILSVISLALTYSRGCYVGIAITAIVFFWLYNKKILGILLVIAVPAGIAFLPQNIIDRILSMVNLADTSTSYRLKIYEGTFALLGKFWPCGLGMGEEAYNTVYPFYGKQSIVAPHSHSLFLQLVVSFGIAGLIFFIVLMHIYHKNIMSWMLTYDKKDKNRILFIIFGSLFFGFLIQSIFDYTWYNYRIYMLFWILLALGFSTYQFMKKGEVLI